jgi:hypothetical protein
MGFDSDKAWREAANLVSANKDVLWALAGVFFILPNFAFSILFPQPEPKPGMTPEQLFAMLGEYYVAVWPWLLAMIVIQVLGTLTVLTLFTDRNRPTVGEAIRIGASGIGTMLLAQVLAGFAMLVVSLAIIVLAALTGLEVMAIAAVALAIAAIFYISIRTILLAPIVGVEGERNPVAALRRSWALTQGMAGRMMLFFALIALALIVVLGLVMIVLGTILAVLLDVQSANFVATLVFSVLTGGVTIYVIAIIAAIHRQVSGAAER